MRREGLSRRSEVSTWVAGLRPGAVVLTALCVGLSMILGCPARGQADEAVARGKSAVAEDATAKRRSVAEDNRSQQPARVLILGDSISLGYTPIVRRLLGDTVIVDRVLGNDGEPLNNLSSYVARTKLDSWVKHIRERENVAHWDLIYFNFGLHDLTFLGARNIAVPGVKAERQRVPAWRYQQNLNWLVLRFKKLATKNIFATTTPGVKGGAMDEDQVPLYNFVARRVMRRQGIQIDDLYAVVHPRIEKLQNRGDVHFNKAGYALLGGHVAATIEAALAAERSGLHADR